MASIILLELILNGESFFIKFFEIDCIEALEKFYDKSRGLVDNKLIDSNI